MVAAVAVQPPALNGHGASTVTTKKPKLTKNQQKRERKKQKKAQVSSKEASVVTDTEGESVSACTLHQMIWLRRWIKTVNWGLTCVCGD